MASLLPGKSTNRVAERSTIRVARYLFLQSVQGRLTAWSAFTPSKTSIFSDSLYVAPMTQNSSRLPVRFLTPQDSDTSPEYEEQIPAPPVKTTAKEWEAGSVVGEGNWMFDVDEPSLQVYAFQHREAKDYSGKFSARKGRPWDCTYLCTNEGVDHELRGIKGNVYFISHTDLGRGTKTDQSVSSSKCLWGVKSAVLVLLIALLMSAVLSLRN